MDESYFLHLTVSRWRAVIVCILCLSLPQPQQHDLPMVSTVTNDERQVQYRELVVSGASMSGSHPGCATWSRSFSVPQFHHSDT